MEDNKKLSADAINANSKAEEIRATEKKKKKKKGTGFFAKIGKKVKEIFSELKLVSWPSFPEVLKKTGVVLAVVLVFLICITVFDYPLSIAFKAMMGIE